MKKKIAVHVSGAAALLALGTFVLWPTELKEAATNFFTLPQEAPLTVLFVGDIMLDRAVALHARDYGANVLFRGVQDLFKSADALVGNLEGSVTDYPSIAEQDHTILRFTFDPRFAALLKNLGFTAVSLSNNHALDFGKEGYEQTRTYLTEAGIVPFGHPFNNKALSAVIPIKDSLLCLVGYHSLFDPSLAWVEAEIKKLRPMCMYMVVVAHWGEEYQHQPTPWQRSSAREFIDLGVDVVIGAHPHIVQPVEIYKNRAIFYSLGNFLFDQAFQPEVKRGLAVKVEFTASTTAFTLIPVNTFKEVSLANATTTEAVLAALITDSMPQEIKKSILTQSVFKLAK